MHKNTYIVEGLDNLGKSTLIEGIKNELGFYQVIHCQKPELLDFYYDGPSRRSGQRMAQYAYQRASFEQLMWTLKRADHQMKFIFDRSWLGESVYAELYRGYSGDYVFEIEEQNQIDLVENTRLILLTEDFSKSTHFRDDGHNLGTSDMRAGEQELFKRAFNRSLISDKKIICVTDEDGKFRSKEDILKDALT